MIMIMIIIIEEITINDAPGGRGNKRGGRVLLTEILLPRIAQRGAVCLVSTRG